MIKTDEDEQAIERLLQRCPTMTREAAEEMVRATNNRPTERDIMEARSLKVNAIIGSMDPMHT